MGGCKFVKSGCFQKQRVLRVQPDVKVPADEDVDGELVLWEKRCPKVLHLHEFAGLRAGE